MEFVDDLPRNNKYKYDWPTITKELRENPGKWAVIDGEGVRGNPASAQAVGRMIRKGGLSGIQEGEFDATTRGAVLYARYIGGGENG